MADLEAVRIRLEELQRSNEEKNNQEHGSDQPLSPKRGWQWLADLPEDAQELADLLNEAAPALGLHNYKKFTHSLPYLKSDKTRRFADDTSKKRTKQRLQTAIPISIAPGHINWTSLVATISTEDLAFTSPTSCSTATTTNSSSTHRSNHAISPLSDNSNGQLRTPPPAAPPSSAAAIPSTFTPMTNTLVEVNSGGKVLFCLFEPQLSTSTAPTPAVSRQVTPTPAGMVHSIFKAANAVAAGGGGSGITGGLMKSSGADATEETIGHPHAASTTPMTPMSTRISPTTTKASTSARALFPSVAATTTPFHHATWNSLQDNALEGCIVVKFVSSRLLCQSEQFANELAQHIGVCAPESRILRNIPSSSSSSASLLLLSYCSDANDAAGPPQTNNENTINTATKGLHHHHHHHQQQQQQHTPTMILSSDTSEWTMAYRAAKTLADSGFPDLYDEMSRCNHMLIMEFIPGKGLLATPSAFQPDAIDRTLSDIGRLFALDMLLGNSDRLRCEVLGWRGNDENIMAGSRGRLAGKVVAIDAVVQRRPPGGLMSAEDAACEKLVELALNDASVAAAALAESVERCPEALQALSASLVRSISLPAPDDVHDPVNDVDGTAVSGSESRTGSAAAAAECGMDNRVFSTPSQASMPASSPLVSAFREGLRRGLDSMMGLKGLLEMMFQQISDWISEFIEDIESTVRAEAEAKGGHGTVVGAGSVPPAMTLVEKETHKIRQIKHEAARNRSVSEKVAHWKSIFRSRGEDLRAAVEEWQVKRSMSPGAGVDVASPRTVASLACRLTTGFLDGTHPVVDVYELKVRLEHMLQRLRVLQQATATARPVRLFPGVFLSGAVAASSFHTLRHLGITHVINATEDLLLPDQEQGFETVRFPLRDVEEEEISQYFMPAAECIDKALERGGGVLVHCHAGQSRSCTLVLAWMMIRRQLTLKHALEFLHQHRPQAAPNAGYMAALSRLEEELFGTQTVKVRKTKPEPKRCPECGEKVGLSAESVRVHLRMKHPTRLW